jgi:hypothetical protein
VDSRNSPGIFWPYRTEFYIVYHLSTKISPFTVTVLPVPVLPAFAAITEHSSLLLKKEKNYYAISYISLSSNLVDIGQNVRIMEPDVVSEREGRRRDDPTPHPLHIQCPHAGTLKIYRKSV